MGDGVVCVCVYVCRHCPSLLHSGMRVGLRVGRVGNTLRISIVGTLFPQRATQPHIPGASLLWK